MPIYEYACESCGFGKDVLQKLSDEPLKVCPECNEDSFVKRISAVGFRLKGSGWYETDFKTGKKKNLAGGSDSSQSTNSSQGTSSNQSTKQSSPKAKKTDSAN